MKRMGKKRKKKKHISFESSIRGKEKKDFISVEELKNTINNGEFWRLGRLRKDGRISTNAIDFEKLVRLMMVIGNKIEFKGKFRILVEHDPERMVTTFDFFDC